MNTRVFDWLNRFSDEPALVVADAVFMSVWWLGWFIYVVNI